jgi:tRNA-specific 2-thiouridylase
MKLNHNKVAVAMSGGIDSSVTAFLLKRIGYEVIGITMYLYDEIGENGLPSPQNEIFEARRVAESLGISHHVADFRPAFDWVVKQPCVKAYAEGKTPNPCVECNRQIQYGKLLEYAMELGAYYLATGHYASVEFDDEMNRHRLFCAKAENKDQSYLLHRLGQGQLSHVLLPLGDVLSKDQVREAALEMGIDLVEKKDSKDICFIPGNNSLKFVGASIPCAAKLGEVVDAQNKRVVWGENAETYVSQISVERVSFIPFDALQLPIRVKIKVCQGGCFLDGEIFPERDKRVRVVFDKPERAPAPGQWAVFYRDGEVLGGGMIKPIKGDLKNENLRG